MLGVHINTVLGFREHHAHVIKDYRKLAKALTKWKITLEIKQILKSKYHATHLLVFNDRQLTEINGILNKSVRQVTVLLSDFPTEEV